MFLRKLEAASEDEREHGLERFEFTVTGGCNLTRYKVHGLFSIMEHGG